MQRVAVVVFPGSNCDADTLDAASLAGSQAYYVWHRDTDLKQADAVILPGGFSYGDYLRSGAIARFSPVLRAVAAHAKAGGPVLGICNGFQILCEAGLLPGALVANRSLKFVCEITNLRVETTDTAFTYGCRAGEVLSLPIKHGEGCYVADEQTLAELEQRGQIVFRYADRSGRVTPEVNPNGSLNNIAGVCNPERNVVGLMPHPEHAVERLRGGEDGLKLFRSVQAWVGRDSRAPRREPTVVPGP